MANDQQRAEERIAHLERMAEDLSDEIARQARAIAALQRMLDQLIAREAEREAEAGVAIPLADQRPPHW
ncbi:MAG: SlyX family protein [Alkalilacustris sp.]